MRLRLWVHGRHVHLCHEHVHHTYPQKHICARGHALTHKSTHVGVSAHAHAYTCTVRWAGCRKSSGDGPQHSRQEGGSTTPY